MKNKKDTNKKEDKVTFKPVSQKVREISKIVDEWPEWKRCALGDNFLSCSSKTVNSKCKL